MAIPTISLLMLSIILPVYDFLYAYLQKEKPEKMTIYADAFKKCADNIIANGVPHNNWNLLQAHYIMNIALILEDDAKYADSKGRSCCLDYLVNQSSIRQWSLKKLADYGFDAATKVGRMPWLQQCGGRRLCQLCQPVE